MGGVYSISDTSLQHLFSLTYISYAGMIFGGDFNTDKAFLKLITYFSGSNLCTITAFVYYLFYFIIIY